MPHATCTTCDSNNEVERSDGEVVPCACQYDYPVCPICLGVPTLKVIVGDVVEERPCFDCRTGMAIGVRRAS